MARTFRIFLSSTGRELQVYRDAIHNALTQISEVKVVRMEDFTAVPNPPLETCRQALAGCDALLGLVGFQFGSAPPGSQRSYTQLEYDIAIEARMPVLMHMAPDLTPLPHIREPDELYDRQQAFRAGIQGLTHARAEAWASPAALAQAAARGVEAFIKQRLPVVESPSESEHLRLIMAQLEALSAEVRRLGTAAPETLLKQQEAATRKLANPDASFAEMREAVAAVATELQALTGPAEAPALAAALADMGHADFAAADRLLAAVESRSEGKAAYARAIIAGIDYRLADARRLFERAAQLDPDTDKRLVNAAMACGATGDFQSAARWADQALARAQRRGDRLETVRAATCLGAALQGVGDFQRAGWAHQLAFDQAVTLEEDSNEFLAAHTNFGLFLLTMVDPRSEQLLRRVVDVTERRRGRDTPSYATAIGNYACVCRLTNRWDEAEQLFETARDIFAAKLGRRSPAYTRQLAQLGMTRAMRMPFAGADQMVVEALEIDREVLGQQHPEYGAKLAMLGGLRIGQQRFAEAESLFRQALTIAERTFGPQHPETAGSRFGLANALAMQQRLPEALPMLEHAEQVFRTSYGPQHPQTQQAGMALQQLRTMMGPVNPMERLFPGWFGGRN